MKMVSGKTNDGYVATGILTACNVETNEAIIVSLFTNMPYKVVAESIIEYKSTFKIEGNLKAVEKD